MENYNDKYYIGSKIRVHFKYEDTAVINAKILEIAEDKNYMYIVDDAGYKYSILEHHIGYKKVLINEEIEEYKLKKEKMKQDMINEKNINKKES